MTEHRTTTRADRREPSAALAVVALASALIAVLILGRDAVAVALVPLMVCLLVTVAISLRRLPHYLSDVPVALVGLGVIVADVQFVVRSTTTTGADPEAVVKALLWVLPLALVSLRDPRSLLAGVLTPPASWLAALFSLTLFLAPLSETPVLSALASLNFLVTTIAAAWLVHHLGWRRTERALGASLLILQTAHLVEGVFGLGPINVASEVDTYLPGITRLDGWASHPNLVAPAAGASVIIGCAITRRASPHRLLGVALLGVGSTSLLWTQSRTALVAVVVALGFTLLRRRPTLAVVAGIVGAGAMVAVLATGSLDQLERDSTDLGYRTETELASLSSRSTLWPIVIDKVEERPLFGWGKGASRVVLTQTATRDFAPDFVHAHNLYLQVLFASGATGLGLFVIAHISYIRQARHHRDPWRDALVVFVSVLGIAESALGEVTPRAITYVWIAAVCAAGIPRDRKVFPAGSLSSEPAASHDEGPERVPAASS
jgi:O-antigen ligase